MQDEMELLRLEAGFDEQAVPVLKIKGRRVIFCQKLNVGYSEFYSAESAGFKGLMKVKAYKADYANEQHAVLDGKQVQLLRSYDLSNDFIELTWRSYEGKDGAIVQL